MRRVAFLLVGLVVCAALAAPVPKEPVRKLGPEWVKEKDGKDYVRKLELTTVASGGESGYLYTHLPLVDYKRKLYVTEELDFRGRTLGVRLSGEEDPPKREEDDPFKYSHPKNMALEMERTEGKDSNAVKHNILLGKVRYFDLNGDGFFDAMVDRREEDKPRSYILFPNPDGELALVRIWTLDRKLNMDPLIVETYHSKAEYVFDKGKWRVWTVEDKRKAEGGKEKDKDK